MAAKPTPADTTAPAAISDLSITGQTTTTIDLQWTSPADAVGGGYVIKYRTADALSETNWNYSSTVVVLGISSPQAGGNTETHTVTGLTTGTTYYFDIKTFDDTYNQSDLSNGTSGATS